MADLELVIKIPEYEYKFVQNTSFVENESTIFKQTNAERKKTLVLFDILYAIRNGTPLPENHGRLIDGDKVLDEIEKQYPASVSETDKRKRYARLVYFWAVKNAPTIIEGSDSE